MTGTPTVGDSLSDTLGQSPALVTSGSADSLFAYEVAQQANASMSCEAGMKSAFHASAVDYQRPETVQASSAPRLDIKQQIGLG